MQIDKNLSNKLVKSATSARKIFMLSMPLMITELSTSLMLLFDRLILSNYSYETMNAAISAGATVNIFQYGILSLTTIATVFSGRHNGARHYDKVTEPVWQMIWFSIISSVLFISLGIFAGTFFVNASYHATGLIYYKILMSFGFLTGLIGALSSFFISTGKTKTITIAAITANIINCSLDMILVFGIQNIIEPMGIYGAAIATVVSQICQIIILLIIFFKNSNQIKFKTRNMHFNLDILIDCLKTGIPVSFSHIIEFSAWAFIIYLLSGMGNEYMLVYSIGYTLFHLYRFAQDGLQKTTASIAANIIGDKKYFLLNKLLLSSFKVHILMVIICMMPAIFFPEYFVKMFSLFKEETIYPSTLQAIYYTLISVWIYFILDGTTWLIASILTAFKDTFIPMLANGLASWLIAVAPIIIFVVYRHGDPEIIWIIPSFYTTSIGIFYWTRLKKHLKRVN